MIYFDEFFKKRILYPHLIHTNADNPCIKQLNKFFLFNRFQFPLLTECMENLSWVEVKLFSFLKDSCISLQQPSCISFYSVIYIHRINIVIVINSLLYFLWKFHSYLYEKEMMLLACSCRTMNFVWFVGIARQYVR